MIIIRTKYDSETMDISFKEAFNFAIEVHDHTGDEVEVHDQLGDPIYWIEEDGTVHAYR